MRHSERSSSRRSSGCPAWRDIDLAERLGYERPIDIRKLIRRYEKSGDLSRDDILATVARNDDPRGRGRPGTEFWLSEAAALWWAYAGETWACVSALRRTLARALYGGHGLIVDGNA